MSLSLVGLDEIRGAAARIGGLAVRTPLVAVGGTPDVETGGAPLLVKCEHLQPAGAFKIRGALNFLVQLPPASRRAGVITYSSGNHGQALALAARHLGVRAVVVMPESAPRVKVEGVQRFGGEVIVAGTTSVDRRARAEAEAAARGLTIVPPFDHPWIIAGAGTCGLEIVEQCPEVSAIFVPVGGGGLVAGIAAAAKALRSSIRIIGVEPAGAPKMTAARAAGRPVRLDRTSSIADGLVALQTGDLTFAHVQALVDEVMIVTEEAIVDAMRWLHTEAALVAEPSGAVSVAGARAAARPGSPSVAVISGGNVSPADHARYVRVQRS